MSSRKAAGAFQTASEGHGMALSCLKVTPPLVVAKLLQIVLLNLPREMHRIEVQATFQAQHELSEAAPPLK